MNFFGCIFGHEFTKWEQYIRRIRVVVLEGPMAGKEGERSEERQHRHCVRCGYKQDSEVSDV